MASSIQIPVTQTGLEASIEAAAKRAGRNLQINLGSNAKSISSLSQPLGKITGQADEFTKSMEAANARVFAFGASVGIVNMVSKAFGALVKNTIAVESSLAEINVVLGKNSQELDKFGNQLFDLAKSTGQTFDIVAKGALELSRQGLNATDTIKRLNDAMILSRLSGLDAQQSVEGLTAAINSFKEAGISSEQILNKLVNVSQQYAVSERDLIEGIKRSASVANQAGVSFDELVGIITTVQERTARGGAVIGNAFKTIFSKIQDKGALEDLQNLGITVTDAAGKILPATSILQNLAKEFEGLSQIQQTDIAKKLGGVYQLSNLLAALKDLGKEQSMYSKIVQDSATSTIQAYQKNVALNETLASIINRVTLSAEQLGATLGKIGMTDSAKNLLNFFNGLLESIQNVLGEESAMGDFVRGLVKGIGNLVSGPGLALFGAIIAKLSKDLVEFGFSSLKSFFKIGDAAKEISNIQNTISNTLLTNKSIQQQILAIENSSLSVEEKRAAQTKFFTEALNTQLAVMNQMKGIAIGIAPGVYGSAGGKTIKGAASGYMPAITKETSDINRGVGGARSGDRPVVIPNFAFGGGKRGSLVAHTGEYIVPNFANGGSAIFNRDMVQSMGLPSGAKRIGAAGGFIPNFATFNEREYQSYLGKFRASKVTDLQTYASGRGRNTSAEYVQAAQDALKAKLQTAPISRLNTRGSNFAMIAGQIGSPENKTIYTDAEGKSFTLGPTNNSVYAIDVPIYKLNAEKYRGKDTSMISNQLASISASTALKMAKDMTGGKMPAPENLEYIKKTLNSGSLNALSGSIFESGVVGILNDKNFKDFSTRASNALIDFAKYKEISDLFDIPNSVGKNGIEAKANAGDDLVKSAAEKFFKNLVQKKSAGVSKRASHGYIPNFANPLKAAVDREMAAGVPASQIYIDKNPSLKNASNPMGLMVANRRDEPMGGSQGINRAIKEGRNPQTYGAANGFIPNFAPKFGNFSNSTQSINQTETLAFRDALIDLTKELRMGKKSFNQAVVELDQYSQMLNISEQDQKKLSQEGSKLLQAYNDELTIRNKRAQELKSQRQQQSVNGPSNAPAQSKDMLGTIFAVQGFLSVLSGFTQDLDGISGKTIKGLNDIASVGTTAAFAANGLKTMGGSVGKLAGALGPWGIAAAAVFEGFKVGADIYNEHLGVTKIVNESLAKMSDAAQKASINLSSMSKSNQIIVRQNAKQLFEKATSTEGNNFLDLFEGWGDELPNALLDAIAEASASGVFDADISKMLTEKRQNKETTSLGVFEVAKFTAKEVTDLISTLMKLKEATQGARESLLNFDFSKNPELLKNLLAPEEVFQANLLGKGKFEEGGIDPYQSLRDLLATKKVENPIPQDELIQALRKKLIDEENLKNTERKNQLELVNLDLAKDALKNALELAKIRDRSFGLLDKEIMAAKILGNLSQKEVRNLEYLNDQREIERHTADETASVITAQIDKIKGISGLMSKAVEFQQQLSSMSTEDLNNKYKVLEILEQINSVAIDGKELSDAEKQSLSNKIETLMQIKELSAKDLERKKQETEEAYKQAELFKNGLKSGFTELKDKSDIFSFSLGKELPQLFSDNMTEAMTKLIDGGESFGEVLKNAAYNFTKEINSKLLGNMASQFTSYIGSGTLNFLGKASGGQIIGGSGVKDDVPAMLMGGEFVINKKAVQKYGPNFLNALNNGNISGYAKGGKVQKGPQGNYFTPGQYGLGAIQGSGNLLDFATQAYTFGGKDKIKNKGQFASISLESESARLTNFGRTNGPAAEALRSAKEESFNLYIQEYQAKKEAQKQNKAQDKALRNQLIMLAATTALSVGAGAAGTGFKNAYAASVNKGGARIWDATKGMWSGGDIGSGIMGGGLKNLFSGNFGLANQTSISKAQIIQESGISSPSNPLPNSKTNINGQFRATAYGLASIDKTTAIDQKLADAGHPAYKGFSQTIGASRRTLQAGYSVASNYFPLGAILNINGKEYRVDDRGGMSNNVIDFFSGGDKAMYNRFANMGALNVTRVRATGGSIPSTSGIDTVKTMLSGGEFIMNRAATQNIGAGNLQALNSGAKSLPTEEKNEELNDRLLAKLDELINASGSAGNITINVEGSGRSSESSDGRNPEAKQQLARQIRDAVLKVIQDEKRLGGQLRRGM